MNTTTDFFVRSNSFDRFGVAKRTGIRVICLCLSVLMSFFLFACSQNEQNTEADKVKTEAISLIKYFGGIGGVANLPTTELDWSGAEVISSNSVFVARTAHRFGLKSDANSFLTRLETEFGSRYDTLAKVQSAPISLLCNITLLLVELEKDPNDFCGYNLADLAAFNNTSLVYYEDIYSMPLMLEVMYYTVAPSNSVYTPEILLEKIFSQFSSGGFSYNMGDADVDTTAMVLLGVSLFEDKLTSDMRSKYSQAFDTLLTFKNADGTYKSMFSEASSSSTALSISAFENSTGAVGILTKFKNADGGYRAGLEEGESDSFSSKDVLFAYYHIFPRFAMPNQ